MIVLHSIQSLNGVCLRSTLAIAFPGKRHRLVRIKTPGKMQKNEHSIGSRDEMLLIVCRTLWICVCAIHVFHFPIEYYILGVLPTQNTNTYIHKHAFTHSLIQYLRQNYMCIQTIYAYLFVYSSICLYHLVQKMCTRPTAQAGRQQPNDRSIEWKYSTNSSHKQTTTICLLQNTFYVHTTPLAIQPRTQSTIHIRFSSYGIHTQAHVYTQNTLARAHTDLHVLSADIYLSSISFGVCKCFSSFEFIVCMYCMDILLRGRPFRLCNHPLSVICDL